MSVREIRAGADREREVILATAYKTSQKLSGEGDAEAAATYGSLTRFARWYEWQVNELPNRELRWAQQLPQKPE